MKLLKINNISKLRKKLAFLTILTVASLNFGGCAKALNPAGSSDFSCPNSENGVCASVKDVYQNRQDIEGYKNERAYKDLPSEDEYIQRECGVEKFLEDENTYRICKRKAKEEYKELVKNRHKKAIGETKNPLKNNSFKNVVKAKEGIPIRQPEKVTRIWIAPYENDMGDLVYSHFIYVIEDPSDWVFTSEDKSKEIVNGASPVKILNGGQ